MSQSDELCRTPFFSIHKEKLPGIDYDYFVLKTEPEALQVVATTPEGLFVITREYRHPTAQTLLGLPGGIRHAGETQLECARRELLEETGYDAEHFECIGEAFPFPGITGQKTIYVRAQGAYIKQAPNLEPSERIQTLLLSKEDLLHRLASGEPVDGLLCTALFWVVRNA